MRQSFKLVVCLSLFCLLLLPAFVFAEKPEVNKNLEILPDETESYYRFENMRVSRETGIPLALYRVNYTVKPGLPDDMARQYLMENAAHLGLKKDLSDLQHMTTIETPGGFHVRFFQYVGNFQVYKAEIVVNLNRSNEVVFVMNGYKPNVNISNKSVTINKSQAYQKANNYLGISGKINFQDTETIVYYNKGVSRLAQRVVIVPSEKLFGDWEVLVDAQSGEIFKVFDQALYSGPAKKSSGSGWVFDPDPLTRAKALYTDPGFGDNNDQDHDSLTAQLVTVPLMDITYSSGQYHLRGPYAQIVDVEAPFDGVFSQADSIFHYTRGQDAFEATNTYHHIDKSMRYINETLGFSLTPFQYTGGVKADPHGFNGADNSRYSSSAGDLSFGEGGVDDAEDEDVLLHELGHGIHDWLTNGSLSQVDGLSEGCGDYWAVSYNRSTGFWLPSDPQYNWVFQWDGHNTFWSGRVTDWPNLYPGGLVGQIHTDGQIWASTLMQIYDDIGRFATDSDFLEALAMTSSSTNQEDAAQAFIQADLNLFGGANLSYIEQHFVARGYNITIPAPSITHTPLTDTEDLNGPYVVNADINSAVPLGEVLLIFGTDGVFTDTVDMVVTKTIYTAQIPGSGSPANYNYYISAVDTAGLGSTNPGGAPGNYHSFTAGPDTVSPVITHNALRNQAYIRWPANVSAKVTDNIGVDSVVVNYYVNSPGNSGSFSLIDNGNGNYSAPFDIDTNSVSVGDSVFYRITATDISSNGNITNHPESGFNTFEIIATKGVVLIVDDDPLKKELIIDSKGTYIRNKESFGASSDKMERWLNQLGYVAEVMDVSTALTANWGDYSIVVHSSGANESPIADGAYRTKWETYVVNPDNKYLIEGGEVGYDAGSSPGYPTFAAGVLHTDTWSGDNAGDINLKSGFETHPMVIAPNALPLSFSINYVGWGDQDAMNTTDGYILYETTTDPDFAGISLYDDNPNSQSAQMAYFAFNFDALSDTSAALALLENTMEYLLTIESGAIGVIEGNVDLSDNADDSGVTLYLSGVTSDTVTTDSNGDYAFTGLYNGFYSVAASMAGYYPYSSTVDNIEVNDNTVSGINFVFDPIVTGTVSGTVTLSDTTDYSGVEVIVIGKNTISDTTDASGIYSISGVMPGNLKVLALKEDYKTVQIDTSLGNDGANIVIDILLEPGLNSFVFDFEADDNGFAGTPSWQWGAPSSGPGSAFQGVNVWATNLGGDYTSNEHAELETPELNLAGFSNPKLKFAHWFNIEESSTTPGRAWDGGNVKISTDGGTMYTLVYPQGGYPDSVYASTTSNALAGQRVYSGLSSGWELAEFDLSAYAGLSVKIKFDFGTDGSVTRPGWYIDSVSVYNDDTAPQPPANLTVLDNQEAVKLGWSEVTKNLLNRHFIFEKSEMNFDFSETLQKDLQNPAEPVDPETFFKNASQYNIYKSSDGGLFALTGNTTSTTYKDTAVAVGNTYYYYVTAVSGVLESDPSDTVSTIVAPLTSIELIYDDDDPSNGYFWDVAGTGSGNRMTPPGNVKIMKAKFYMRTPQAGYNTFTAKVFDFINNQPGVELGSVQIINAANNSWAEVNVSDLNITTDHDFLVFMEYDAVNQPVFGFDLADNGRAWDYDPNAGGWAAWNETYFMRAVVELVSGLELELGGELPRAFAMDQNYPNPFNPETTVKFQLPKAADVTIAVYNMLGQKVRMLVNQNLEAGYYSAKWDGLNETGEQVASGLYLYRIEAGDFIQTNKMLFLK